MLTMSLRAACRELHNLLLLLLLLLLSLSFFHCVSVNCLHYCMKNKNTAVQTCFYHDSSLTIILGCNYYVIIIIIIILLFHLLPIIDWIFIPQVNRSKIL